MDRGIYFHVFPQAAQVRAWWSGLGWIGKHLVRALGLALLNAMAASANTGASLDYGFSELEHQGPLGILRVDPTNPRYFNDGTKAVFLTGSHVWLNLQDFSIYANFDFTAYLDFLTARNYNFVRLWNLDEPYKQIINPPRAFVTLGSTAANGLPFARPGPGTAGDGNLKFDLAQFNQAYFDRLRARIIAAGDRGIYVSIMLFDGFWVNGGGATQWGYSQYNPVNNVNGYSMTKADCYTMNNSAWVALMDAYLNKVVDTVNDLDNVLYEVINEAPASSKVWQYHVINHIKAYEATKAKQHPLGMSAYDTQSSNDSGSNTDLLASPADWVALAGRTNPASVADAPATKVSILDTDHTWGLDPAGDDSPWVWKSLTRGHNPIYMDPWTYAGYKPDAEIRAAMERARILANRLDLAQMVPSGSTTSTGYALVDATNDYLIYQPANASFTVNLPARIFSYEWTDPATGSITNIGSFTALAGNNTFTLPGGYNKGALLHLTSTAPAPTPVPGPALINGSFESGLTGWTATGNLRITSTTATDGIKAVQKNFAQLPPNGVLTQSFATTAGQTYGLSFDLGTSAYQSTAEQRLQVTVQGNNVLRSETVSIFAQGTGTWYAPQSFTFVADSATTILTFEDVSPTTANIDLLLDYVRVTVPLQLTTAVSRKPHGGAGTFDIDLPLTGTPGVECRSSGGSHTLVFTFNNNVVSGSASVITGAGSVSGSPTFAGNTMTVNLTGVADVQKITRDVEQRDRYLRSGFAERGG